MSNRHTFVILGAGLAGTKAADTLREEGFDGRVLLIGAEPEPPYDRPPLSKEYLRGEVASEQLWMYKDLGHYESAQIELCTQTEVRAVRASTREVELASGERIRFDKLLLATGAEPRRPRIVGAALEDIHYLRNIGDCDRLRRRIALGGHIVIVGGGWIGAEVAASARQRDCQVTLIESARVPLERVLGAELGALYRDIHTARGVEFIGEREVERFEGAGRVERVVLGDGRTIPCDFALVGIGMTPCTALAASAGVKLENGVLVDELLQSNIEGIYAAGDIANAYNPLLGRHVRVEHWANALHQGLTAARSMLGKSEPYDRVPHFFYDRYDVGMEYSGYATEWEKLVFRGDPASREFIIAWLKGGRPLTSVS